MRVLGERNGESEGEGIIKEIILSTVDGKDKHQGIFLFNIELEKLVEEGKIT